jgi:hypothetical protein
MYFDRSYILYIDIPQVHNYVFKKKNNYYTVKREVIMAVTPDPHTLLSTSLALYQRAGDEQQSVGALLSNEGAKRVQSLLTSFENFLKGSKSEHEVATTVAEHRILRQLFDSDPTKAFAVLLEGYEEIAKENKDLKPQVARIKELFSTVHIEEATIGLEKLSKLQKSLQLIAQANEKNESDILFLQTQIKRYSQEQQIDYREFVLSEDIERLLVETQIEKLTQSLGQSKTIEKLFDSYNKFKEAISKIRADHEVSPSSEIDKLMSANEKEVLYNLLERCIETMDAAKSEDELRSICKKLYDGFTICSFSDPLPFLNDFGALVAEKASNLASSDKATLPTYQPTAQVTLASGKTISLLQASARSQSKGFQPTLLQRIKLQAAITLVHIQPVLASAALGYMTQAEPLSSHMAYAVAFCGAIAGIVQIGQTLPKSIQSYVPRITFGLFFIHFITRFDAVHKITQATQYDDEGSERVYYDYFNPLKTAPEIDLSLNQTSLRSGPGASDIPHFEPAVSLIEENSPIPLQPMLSPVDPRDSWCFWPKLPLTEQIAYNVSTPAETAPEIPIAPADFKETVSKTNNFWQSFKLW